MSKPAKSILEIPGTRYNSQNAQLLVSTGIPSLDDILGGGLPVGSVSLIEEDKHGLYSKVILKYFLAEGLVCKHSLFVASQDMLPGSIISDLPAPIAADSDPTPIKNKEIDDKMKIAFRYQNLPTKDKESTTNFGHHYDLSKTMADDELKAADVEYWSEQEPAKGKNTFSNPAYHDLLESVRNALKKRRLFLKDNLDKRSVLRIALHSLGSPMWLPGKHSLLTLSGSRDLDMFLFCLRALCRSAFAVALVSVPTHLYDENSMGRCIHSSDVAMRLQAFAGTDLEANTSLADYHGFFHLTKLAAINTFALKHPGSVEYAFKLRRKKFCIEMLHLPPDIQDEKTGDSKKKQPLLLGCGSSDKHLYEF